MSLLTQANIRKDCLTRLLWRILNINLLDLIYPRRCPICREIVTPRGTLIHNECENKLIGAKEPRCKKCGKPLFDDITEYCYNCRKGRFHFVEGRSLWIYDDIMRKSISDFKFNNCRENADYYIKCLTECCEELFYRWAPDALVPVPIHRSKKRYRGYNQAEILAKGVGKAYNIPVYSDLLLRDKATLPQKNLNSTERLRNLEHAFTYNIKKYKCNNGLKNIVLVDDIYTTGCTVEACTRVCMKNGIKNIYFICLCTGQNYQA